MLLGLSGGVDSSIVAAIAVDALGAERVRTVMMPSPYTAEISWLDARAMAARLGVRISWREHARTGIPVTLATLAIAAAWLALRAH